KGHGRHPSGGHRNRPGKKGIPGGGSVTLSTTTASGWLDVITDPAVIALHRSGQTATELPSTKKILVAGGTDAQDQFVSGLALFNPAKIWTDKDDYLPGDNVILSGSGWKPNE